MLDGLRGGVKIKIQKTCCEKFPNGGGEEKKKKKKSQFQFENLKSQGGRSRFFKNVSEL